MVQLKFRKKESVGRHCERAAAKLRSSGWIQGEFESSNGERCLVAAINAVIGVQASEKLPWAIRERLHNHLMATRQDYRSYFSESDTLEVTAITNATLFSWNDLPTTTKFDVIELLLGVALAEKYGMSPSEYANWSRELDEASAELLSEAMVRGAPTKSLVRQLAPA